MAVKGFQVVIDANPKQIIVASTVCQFASLQADPNNGDVIYVGGSDVDPTHGNVITPGNALPLGFAQANSIQLNAWYVYAANIGDKVNVVYQEL
jgi:hypothetical protein